ncbi:SH3 domain-containing protein [Oleiphilus messinensis]|uniref:SH3 domain-containing protein n=1 Tax=Oleiphilus messinensis TaxID=141451 RepID=A0A1Y0I7E9_9GAMM|nr:outer membrane beta-barrel protein [Oleiphilus messinensis]ARU56371.1 SH3 domain-containing protein [Oleiphilus messinensis]
MIFLAGFKHFKYTWSQVLLCLVLAAQALPMVGYAEEITPERNLLVVEVIDPFVELKTGPGRGYPVFFVVRRGEQILLLKQKTGWIKVETREGHHGWVTREQLAKTLALDGTAVEFVDVTREGYHDRRWEVSVLAGQFASATSLTLSGAYLFTDNISMEMQATQVLGDFSESQLVNIGITHQPWPLWRWSPYFGLGIGKVRILPKATLVKEKKRLEDAVHVGIGLRYYLGGRFFGRFEYRESSFFTERDDNEEAEEWKIGLGVFF